MNDITELKRELVDRALAAAEHLLPRGVLEGKEGCVGSTAGEPGKSLKVCVRGHKAGRWADFAAAGESGDLVDLWQLAKRFRLGEAPEDIRGWLGVTAPTFEKRAKECRRPSKPKGGSPKSAVFDYFTRERKLSAAALRAYQLDEDGRTILFSSFLPAGELALVKYLGIDRSPGAGSAAGSSLIAGLSCSDGRQSIPKPASLRSPKGRSMR